MLHMVMGDPTHWRIGNHIHFGLHTRGECFRLWKFRRQKYRSGRLTFYSWWRLFLAVDKD